MKNFKKDEKWNRKKERKKERKTSDDKGNSHKRWIEIEIQKYI